MTSHDQDDKDIKEPRAVRAIGLPLTLTLVIGVALALTGINMALYFGSNLSRIDLSKPKYADIRGELQPSVQTADKPELDTSSPITREAIREQIDELKRRQTELRKLGGFDSPVLDDAPLGISEQPTQ